MSKYVLYVICIQMPLFLSVPQNNKSPHETTSHPTLFIIYLYEPLLAEVNNLKSAGKSFANG